MRIALQIAYDGCSFYGYARQPNLRTVEGELHSLLHSNGVTIERFRSASRTDKHVSALCNIIAFDTTLSEDDISSIHRYSTREIIIYGYAFVNESFYPRHASFRQYRYFIPKNLITLDLLLDTLNVFIGEYDFRNFARIEPKANPVRTIEMIVIGTDNEFFWIDFFARTFLWHQIRRIISAVLKVEKGKITKAQIQYALNHPAITADFGLAPAEPLILRNIFYDSISFIFFPNMKHHLSRIEKSIKNRSINLFS